MSEDEAEDRKSISERIPTAKHRAFIEKYFELFMNASAAYGEVYGTSGVVTRSNASRLLTNDNIKEEINFRLNEMSMPANEVLLRLAAMARGELETMIKEGPDSDEIKTYDAKGALELIGKYHAMFTDKIDHSGKVDIPVTIVEVVRLEVKDD